MAHPATRARLTSSTRTGAPATARRRERTTRCRPTSPRGRCKYDTPAIPAVGHATFGDLGGTGPSFLTPAAGVLRALDLGVNEYQGGQDFVAAYDTTTGQFRPGFPTVVNDLQFITGPSVADIDGLPGEEVVGGSASLDLFAFNATGDPASTKWPKPTSDWTVANPVLGSFDTQDTDASARKVVVAMTRAGTLFAYTTDAAACSPGSWPTFHHDLANSGDYRRDATLPGRPYDLANTGAAVTFKAPGDDLLCGTATSYQVVQSDDPITGANFSSADPIAGAPAPAAAGHHAVRRAAAGPAPVRRDPRGRRPGQRRAGRADRGRTARLRAPQERDADLRPAGDRPTRACGSPNRRHAAPLSFESCNPPQAESAQLTVGTPDANGKPANSTGALRLVRASRRPGDAGGRSRRGDLLQRSPTCARARTCPTTPVSCRSHRRCGITDRNSGPGRPGRQPSATLSFRMTPALLADRRHRRSARPARSSRRFERVLPGSVTEGKRAIWQLGQVEVSDGGPDGNAASTARTRCSCARAYSFPDELLSPSPAAPINPGALSARFRMPAHTRTRAADLPFSEGAASRCWRAIAR